jgi:hypothetical protein
MMAEQTDVLAKPLPKPVAPPGKGRVGFKEAMGISEPFMTRKAEIQPQITQAEGDIAKAQQEQKEIKATGELSAQKQFGQEQEAAMQGYQEKLEKEPLPAFIPSKDTAQDIAGLFSVISVISMLVGGGGKMSGQLALGNMNGMMEGYRKGRDDLYKKERTEFDKNFNAMLKKHAEFRQEMEDAVKLATTNKEEGLRAAELAATRAGSDIVKAQLRKGDLIGAYNLVSESQKGAEHALQIEQKARAEEEAAKERRQRAAEAAALRRELVSGRTTAGEMKREDKIREMTQGIRSIENLQNQLRDPDVRAGLQAKAAPLLEKIGSLGGAEFETAVNNALTGTDKTTLFLKDALLETYAIERAAKGGQRLTVQDMKMVGPVLDPTNYSADTYNALLDSRRKVLYNNLQDMNLTPAQIKEKSAQKPYESYAGEQVPTVTTQEQYDALSPGAYYLEDGVRYQKPRGK